jgi:hypothetical protein
MSTTSPEDMFGGFNPHDPDLLPAEWRFPHLLIGPPLPADFRITTHPVWELWEVLGEPAFYEVRYCYSHIKEEVARDPLIVDPETGQKVCMYHCGYGADATHDVHGRTCPYLRAVDLEARLGDELARLERVRLKLSELRVPDHLIQAVRDQLLAQQMRDNPPPEQDR